MAGATALLPSAEEFLRALDAVPTGTFNKHTMQAIRARVARAEELGIPVLVKLGDTKFFAVRDGPNFNRNVVGGWAHVKCEESGGKTTLRCKVGQRLSLILGLCNRRVSVELHEGPCVLTISKTRVPQKRTSTQKISVGAAYEASTV